MSEEMPMGADESFVRQAVAYLDGTLDGTEFDEFQEALRESAERRREFLQICVQAQACTEVAAFAMEEPVVDRPVAVAGSSRRSFWQRAAIGAAAAVLVAAGGVWFWGGGGTSEPEGVVSKPVPRGGAAPEVAEIASVSLLEPRPGGFALSQSVPVVQPPFEEIEPAVIYSEEPPAGWLDNIGLQLIYVPAQASRPDDIRL